MRIRLFSIRHVERMVGGQEERGGGADLLLFVELSLFHRVLVAPLPCNSITPRFSMTPHPPSPGCSQSQVTLQLACISDAGFRERVHALWRQNTGQTPLLVVRLSLGDAAATRLTTALESGGGSEKRGQGTARRTSSMGSKCSPSFSISRRARSGREN